MKIDLQKVLPQVVELCGKQGVKYLVTRNLANIEYLTGFSLHSDSVGAAVVLITPRKVILFSDPRYGDTIQEIAAKNPLIQAVIWKRKNPLAAVVRFVRKGKELGFEGTNAQTSYSFVKDLRKAAAKRGIRLQGTKDIVETVRKIKFSSEIRILKQAFELTDQAFFYILKKIKPGLTEIEIARLLGAYLRKISSCEELSFRTIIASGPNSAIPHAKPSNRIIKPGDLVTLDFGLCYQGYHTDMTRTVLIGGGNEKSQQMKMRIYEIVLQAQLAAAQQARVGMTGQELDKIARDIIKKAGYEKNFTHTLGHGVGLAEHEMPWVSKSNFGKSTLEKNMVFSIEPGIYLSGKFGVRIEDIGVLTENGFKPLSKSPKYLIII